MKETLREAQSQSHNCCFRFTIQIQISIYIYNKYIGNGDHGDRFFNRKVIIISFRVPIHFIGQQKSAVIDIGVVVVAVLDLYSVDTRRLIDAVCACVCDLECLHYFLETVLLCFRIMAHPSRGFFLCVARNDNNIRRLVCVCEGMPNMAANRRSSHSILSHTYYCAVKH